LPVEPLQEIRSPLLIAVNQHLGMASSSKNVSALFELLTELTMVEDLTSGS
jgi:hypothetical protein